MSGPSRGGAAEGPRRYDATRRRENGRLSQAATRTRILESAAPLFASQGWTGTTVTAIARAAGVSVQTVYSSIGSKVDVLQALFDAQVAGEDPDAALIAQQWVAEFAADPDPRSQLRRLAQASALLGERTAWLHRLLREAAAADPAAAAALDRSRRERHSDQHALVGMLRGGLRAGVDLDTAADIVFGYVSYEVWDLFCVDRGWDPPRLADLTADLLIALLLPPA